jgi:hypothetical protein
VKIRVNEPTGIGVSIVEEKEMEKRWWFSRR